MPAPAEAHAALDKAWEEMELHRKDISTNLVPIYGVNARNWRAGGAERLVYKEPWNSLSPYRRIQIHVGEIK